jgi:hypothetical protein
VSTYNELREQKFAKLPSQIARQLLDLSTIIQVEPSSTGDSRLQGALPLTDTRGAASDVSDA